MEEKKLKAVKESPSKENEKYQKLSYEQLNEACAQLYQQNQYLEKQLQQANLTNMFKRLDYLFMVLANESVIKDADFINDCIAEIKEAIIVKDTAQEEA